MKPVSLLIISLIVIFFFVSSYGFSLSETKDNNIDFDKGLGFVAPDSAFSVNTRFRIQNRVGYFYYEEDNKNEIEASIRRCRLRFDGFIKNPKLTYYIQLSFARADMSIGNDYIHNIIQDAVVYYKINNKLLTGFGQTKVPGNRQRIISSGSQQFADRSIVDDNFNLNKDFGIFAYYSDNIGFLNYNIKTAITTGDGRNNILTDENFAYTGRIELMPFGRFKNNGDFFEGDIEREDSPKVSIGFGFSKNFKANKTSGQTGKIAYEPRDIDTYFADIIIKYNGWFFSSEYSNKIVNNPFTWNFTPSPFYQWMQPIIFYTGYGINTQFSYIFKNNFEIATRLSYVEPNKILQNVFSKNFAYAIGFTKYITKHKTKVQLNFLNYSDIDRNNIKTNKFGAVLQFEIGI